MYVQMHVCIYIYMYTCLHTLLYALSLKHGLVGLLSPTQVEMAKQAARVADRREFRAREIANMLIAAASLRYLGELSNRGLRPDSYVLCSSFLGSLIIWDC